MTTSEIITVTFPNQGKVFLSFNLQTFSNRTFLSKRFSGNNSFCKVNSPSDNSCVWFGLLRSFGSFRHDLGFSADAHRHQVSFGWSFMSSRLVWFMRPLSFGSSPLVCRLRSSITPSPSTPPCAPTVSGESSWYLYDVLCILISAYADHMDRSALKYRRLRLFASLHWCGAWSDTCGGKLALRAGGRRHRPKSDKSLALYTHSLNS